jgi:signal transduction histidine kinase
MIPLIQSRKYPLRFLLYLEWILLSIITCSEILGLIFGFGSRLPRIPLLNLFCLFIFGVIGLKLPYKSRLNKILYTGLEFGLVVLASLQGGILLVPLLYIILIARNCLIFDGVGRLIVTGCAIILSLLTQIHRAKTTHLLQPLAINQQLGLLILVSVLTLGIGAIFIQLAVDALLQEFKSRQKLSIANEQLAIANAQLREYTLRIEELATVEERNRIARDIHDSVGHALTVLNLHLEAALKLWQSDLTEATEFLTEAKHLGSNALKEVRQSITALRVDPLKGLSIQEAITSLVKDFQRSSGILPTVEIDLQSPVTNEIRIAIYRIVQESLTNICKYAAATKVKIEIYIDKDLHLIVSDNGKGFELNQNISGFGLQSMRDRTLAVGGNLEVETSPNSGCKIVTRIPI